MQKLTEQSELNSPQEYDKIFFERRKKGVDEHDVRRWERLVKYFNGGKVLDMGCLDSEIPRQLRLIYLERIMRRGFLYHGIDVAKNTIAAMKKKYTESYYKFFVMDLYKTSYLKNTFDYVILGEVLEHLERPEDAIKEAMRILKPGGVLAISVPLEEAKEPGAVDGHRHLWSFSKQDMRELLEPYGKVKMEVVGSLFSAFPPFYRYHWKSLISFTWKS